MSSGSSIEYSRRITSGVSPAASHAQNVLHRDAHVTNDGLAAEDIRPHGSAIEKIGFVDHRAIPHVQE